MPLRVNNNIMSLNAQRNISREVGISNRQLERVPSGQPGFHNCDERRDVVCCDVASKRAPSELRQNSLSIDKRLVGDDFHSVGEVVDRKLFLWHVAKNATVTFRRPSLVERALNLDELHRQARPVPIFAANLLDRIRAG